MNKFALATLALIATVGTANAVELNKPYTVPSDDKRVVYTFHSVEKVKGNVITIITERDSTRTDSPFAGVEFSKRVVDCKKGTFRYVADGVGTLEEAVSAKVGKGKMENLSEGSVSSYLAGSACTATFGLIK